MELNKLIPSGCERENPRVLSSSDAVCTYCSTMGIYSLNSADMNIKSFVSNTSSTYAALAYSPDGQAFSTIARDGRVCVFEPSGRLLSDAFLPSKEIPLVIDWPIAQRAILIGTSGGDVYKYDKNILSRKIHSDRVLKVIRGHHTREEHILLGDFDGVVVLMDEKCKGQKITGNFSTASVSDIQWDPLSAEYALVSWTDGSLGLFDTSKCSLVTKFNSASSAGPHPIQFVPWQPGNFLSAGPRTGFVHLWNVSKSSPMDSIRVSQTSGVTALSVPKSANRKNLEISSRFFVALHSGAIAAFSLSERRSLWESAAGHTQTIFDCVFDPNDRNLFYSASYDGRAKCWDLETGKVLKEFEADAGQLLYAVTVSSDKIAAASSEGWVFVWRSVRGDLVWKSQIFSGSALRVFFSADGTFLLVSGGELRGEGGSAVVLKAATGEVVVRLNHPTPVYGVIWRNDTEILTASQDAIIRLWRLDSPKDPIAEYRGHSARVFNLAIDPLRQNILASSSDDLTVGIWDLEIPGEIPMSPKSAKLRNSSAPSVTSPALKLSLKGHTGNVRALLWHTEARGILFSGAWDATIRVWDTMNGGFCLSVISDHQGDVYGLTSHTNRPFVMVSCSRDSTIRVWNNRKFLVGDMLGGLLQSSGESIAAQFASLVGKGGEWAVASASAAKPLLGPGSASLANALTRMSENAQVFEILNFFLCKQGLKNFWNILLDSLSANNSDSPGSHFLQEEISRFTESASLAGNGSGVVGTSAAKREEALREAARGLARAGNFSGASETFFACGDHLLALALAPAVSSDFWKKMLNRVVDRFIAGAPAVAGDTGNPNLLEKWAPLVSATGRSNQLTDIHLSRGQLKEAAVTCALSGGINFDHIVNAQLSFSAVRAATLILEFTGNIKLAAETLRGAGDHELALAVLRLNKC